MRSVVASLETRTRAAAAHRHRPGLARRSHLARARRIRPRERDAVQRSDRPRRRRRARLGARRGGGRDEPLQQKPRSTRCGSHSLLSRPRPTASLPHAWSMSPAHASERTREPRVLSAITPARPFALAALHAALGKPMLLLVGRPSEARGYANELRAWARDPDARPAVSRDRRAAVRPPAQRPGQARRAPPAPRAPGRSEHSRAHPTAGGRVGSRGHGPGARSRRVPRQPSRPSSAASACRRPTSPRSGSSSATSRRRWSTSPDCSAAAAAFSTSSRQAASRCGSSSGATRSTPSASSIRPPSARPSSSRRPPSGRPTRCCPGRWREPRASTACARSSSTRSRATCACCARAARPSRRSSSIAASSAPRPCVDYLPTDGLLVIDEPEARRRASPQDFEEQVEQLHADLLERGEVPPGLACPYRPWREIRRAHSEPRLEVQPRPGRRQPAVRARRRSTAAGSSRSSAALVERATHDNRRRQPASQPPERAAARAGRARRAARDPAERARQRVELVHGLLREGWVSDELGLALFTDSEIFGWTKQRRSAPDAPTWSPSARPPRATRSSPTCKPGDLVVHVDHGIARYGGLVRTQPGRTPGPGRAARPARPCRVPAAALRRGRQPVRSRFAGRPRRPLHRRRRCRSVAHPPGQRRVGARQGQGPPLGARPGPGADGAVRRARRARGARLSRSTRPWQLELEGSFPYEETPDQVQAIHDVKTDMESPRPMDRLLVGDVGFGKTEVALRAAFKAVQDGRQVAVLVPTTVLAQQHFNTFRERLGRVPRQSRDAVALPLGQGAARRSSPGSRQAASTSASARTDSCSATSSSRISGWWSSTRSSASASRTRSA